MTSSEGVVVDYRYQTDKFSSVAAMVQLLSTAYDDPNRSSKAVATGPVSSRPTVNGNKGEKKKAKGSGSRGKTAAVPSVDVFCPEMVLPEGLGVATFPKGNQVSPIKKRKRERKSLQAKKTPVKRGHSKEPRREDPAESKVGMTDNDKIVDVAEMPQTSSEGIVVVSPELGVPEVVEATKEAPAKAGTKGKEPKAKKRSEKAAEPEAAEPAAQANRKSKDARGKTNTISRARPIMYIHGFAMMTDHHKSRGYAETEWGRAGAGSR